MRTLILGAVVMLVGCGPALQAPAAPEPASASAASTPADPDCAYFGAPVTRVACGRCWAWCGNVWMGITSSLGACELTTLTDDHGRSAVGMAQTVEAARLACGW